MSLEEARISLQNLLQEEVGSKTTVVIKENRHDLSISCIEVKENNGVGKPATLIFFRAGDAPFDRDVASFLFWSEKFMIAHIEGEVAILKTYGASLKDVLREKRTRRRSR